MSLLSLLRENTVEKSFDDIKNFSQSISSTPSVVTYEDFSVTPISVADKDNGWQTIEDPERLIKMYSFDEMKEVLYFFDEIYKYQNKINHHFKIVVDNLNVTVETYTHGFEGVTELDFKIKKFTDELYNEINYFKRNQ